MKIEEKRKATYDSSITTVLPFLSGVPLSTPAPFNFPKRTLLNSGISIQVIHSPVHQENVTVLELLVGLLTLVTARFTLRFTIFSQDADVSARPSP
jgi:hypothetical protein